MLTHPHGMFDNAPLRCRSIEVRPLAAAMGAEVVGARLGAIDGEQFEEIRAALFRHKMIFLRDQPLDFDGYEAFAARFGSFAEDAYTKGVKGHPAIQPVIREADDASGMIFGSGWHTDSPFLTEPPAISLLYGAEIPEWGGDTIWANAALAYRLLSEPMQRLCDGLQVRMSMARVLETARAEGDPARDNPMGRLAATRGRPDLPEDVARKIDGAAHPLVRTHPATGEKSLYCDGSYAIAIEGITYAESDALLGFLVAHMTQPALTCRLRWAQGTLALWDNRLCIHQAFNDYPGKRRAMYRATIAGEAPV